MTLFIRSIGVSEISRQRYLWIRTQVRDPVYRFGNHTGGYKLWRWMRSPRISVLNKKRKASR